ncbi:MAG: hypothetical protein WB471_00935 [Nocardioides sp.]
MVVEFNQLGGRDLRGCDEAGGGRTASQLLGRQGVSLTYVQRQPGFLCSLDGVPADDACVNTPAEDAYWSLWWSDGSAAGWRYASTGVDSLAIPDGGSLALVWDGVAGNVVPTTPPGAIVAGAVAGASAGSGPASASTRAPRRPPAIEATGTGLPAWVAPAAAGLLFAAAAGTAVVRRRRTGAMP